MRNSHIDESPSKAPPAAKRSRRATPQKRAKTANSATNVSERKQIRAVNPPKLPTEGRRDFNSLLFAQFEMPLPKNDGAARRFGSSEKNNTPPTAGDHKTAAPSPEREQISYVLI